MDAPKEQHLLLGKEMNALRCLFHQCNDCRSDVVRVLDRAQERCFGAVFRRLKLLGRWHPQAGQRS